MFQLILFLAWEVMEVLASHLFSGTGDSALGTLPACAFLP